MDSKTKLYIVFEYIDDCEYIAGICATPEIADYLRNQLEEKSSSFGYDYYENSKEVKRIYSACEKAYNKLYDMFGEDFDDLSEYIEELNY